MTSSLKICEITAACLFLIVLAGGCEQKQQNGPKLEAWQKREQVYTDKTPEEWLKLIQHHNFQVREQAIDALVQYGKANVPALIAILKNKAAGPGRLAACRALGAIGADAQTAAPALVEALRETGWEDRDAAAEALGTIDSNVGVPGLIDALSDREERVRMAAIRALGRLRAGDSRTVSALAAVLEDENTNVRAAAAMALEKIGPKAKAAVPALEKAADAQAFIVAQAADEALKAIRGK